MDFDDCVMGPPIQDIWLLARGEGEEARKAREDLIEGYELFREFDRSTLPLIEPLRAMRIIYMSGWIAQALGRSVVPPRLPELQGRAVLDAGVRGAGRDRRDNRRSRLALLTQNIASGFAGEPVPPITGSGDTISMNSSRPSS